MKRTPLRRRSKKKEKQDEEYYAKRKEFLEAHPFCQVCEAEGWPRRRATDIHHVRGRRGSDYLDESTWLSVSRFAHDRIHWGEQINGQRKYGPAWARSRNYII